MSLLTRRRFLQLSTVSAVGLGLQGCAVPELANLVGSATEPLNQSLEELLFNPQKPVPEYPPSRIQPNQLLVNGFSRYIPTLDPDQYRLVLDGAIAQPLALSLPELYQMTRQSMVIRHVCVEGWAAIVQWAGVPLRELAKRAQLQAGVKYVYFQSADGYYESWDIASCLHPQTLLAYEKNGEPLPIPHGAPLRLASPIKLGYKLSKWVTRLTFTQAQVPPDWLTTPSDRLLATNKALYNLSGRLGFWEDQGYEWFAGL
ncbi:MAG: molybdopterin-dependent oxidoreductase [Synechococcales bacterium]|nr:molybdopterin-dependent oxidoreductase [Synechococcales bacterium]